MQPQADASTPAPPWRRHLRRLTLVLWLLVLVMAGLTFALRSRGPSGSALPVIKDVPPFALTNRDGTPVDLTRLAGKPWVADFIFTRCPGVCPLLTKRLAELAVHLPPEQVNLVSITVDPDHDTPEVLAAYAAEHGAGPNWFFLAGPREPIYSLIKDGFMLVLDPSPQEQGQEAIVHSNRFVLVDAENRIRGYYNAFDAAELDRLRSDLESLYR